MEVLVPQHRTLELFLVIPQEKPDPDEMDPNWSEPDGSGNVLLSPRQHFTAPEPATVAQIWFSPTDMFSSSPVSLK